MNQPRRPDIENFPLYPAIPTGPAGQHMGYGGPGHYYHGHHENVTYEPYGRGSYGWHNQGHHTHYYHGEPPGPPQPMFPNRAFTHPPGNPLGYRPYPDPIYPNPPNPYGPPGPPGPPISGSVPCSSAPQPVVVAMESLVTWIGEHIVCYHESARVKELAEKARHNMDSFLKGLNSYRDMRQRARREQWGPRWTYEMEDLHHRALYLQRLYNSTIGRYKGPFKPKQECSQTESTQAQQLLATMFDRDYEIWNVFIEKLTFWIHYFHPPTS
ncbi:hypothetical protein F4803DRAFT_555036 [Xylaria telfairii]|nr:hypothetical protein F4803DRAFT_555036 [Xylaria telfairii]